MSSSQSLGIKVISTTHSNDSSLVGTFPSIRLLTPLISSMLQGKAYGTIVQCIINQGVPPQRLSRSCGSGQADLPYEVTTSGDPSERAETKASGEISKALGSAQH
ncbi:uncharacterized protein APUU_22013S [Aspergillus puulaauensis]|uniref:Uncharacterized protein n=1 Tax=Aspergillus puulaauensis TaxID=1220207 RepID=A0A7R8AJW4_9EURO|nr:uncharacterized protein APUU_22013S [Aspergillus puulaauensis]BCS21581.1 hypothetical protein APUU_22013S [Aspergillus puulaauensis]